MLRAQVTDRDVRLLTAVGEYGVLDFTLIHELILTGISAERCRQILARLSQTGLIRAVRLQVWYARKSGDNRYRGGRVPTLYVLPERGAEIVQQCTGAWPPRVARSDPTPATFFHRLHIVRVRLAFDGAARACGLEPPHWIMEQDMRPDVSTKLAPNRRRWLYHEFRSVQGTITCQPDATLRLVIPHPTAGATTLAGFLEVDLSREVHAQIKKKLPGYITLLADPVLPYWPDLEQPAMRIFWITLTERRLRELAAALSDSPIADRFRFTTFADCSSALLTEPVWRDVRGRKLTFLKSRK